MSSTNKTTNYNLSQFIGSDKPTYLGDYNSDMQKIDNAMKTNSDNIQTVGSIANTASENANTALENVQTAQNTANTANTNAENAQNTATQALQKGLQNESDIQKFNLTDIQNLNLTSQAGGTFTEYVNAPLKIAKNNDGSIFKVYGAFELTNLVNPPTQFIIKTNDTGLRPQSSYMIAPCGVKMVMIGSDVRSTQPLYLRVNRDGTIDLIIEATSTTTGIRCIIFPCLYFNSDFGD